MHCPSCRSHFAANSAPAARSRTISVLRRMLLMVRATEMVGRRPTPSKTVPSELRSFLVQIRALPPPGSWKNNGCPVLPAVVSPTVMPRCIASNAATKSSAAEKVCALVKTATGTSTWCAGSAGTSNGGASVHPGNTPRARSAAAVGTNVNDQPLGGVNERQVRKQCLRSLRVLELINREDGNPVRPHLERSPVFL